MQAQAQSRVQPGASSSAVNPAIVAILVIHFFMHAIWAIVPQLTDGDEVGLTQYIVQATEFTIGIIGIAGIWKGYRWGWWTLLVLTVLKILLALPEVFFLEGVMRAGSIVAFVGIIATAVLLFRPGVRAKKS